MELKVIVQGLSHSEAAIVTDALRPFLQPDKLALMSEGETYTVERDRAGVPFYEPGIPTSETRASREPPALNSTTAAPLRKLQPRYKSGIDYTQPVGCCPGSVAQQLSTEIGLLLSIVK